MKRSLGIAAATMFAVVGLAAPASAGQPADPGCFGQDRAGWIAAHSGAEWGAIASGERAGDNAAINAQYKADNCG